VTPAPIVCTGLEVAWPPAAPVLDIPHLELAPGSVTAVVGPSGAGKSTLGHALAGLLPWLGARVEGGVEYAGRILHPGRADEWRAVRGRLVRWIPQDPALSFTPTRPLLPQMLEGPGRAGPLPESLDDLLAAVGLDSTADLAGRYPFELSGGELQRAAAVTAFGAGPSLVVADEPTAHLDPPNALALARTVIALVARTGTGLLWITHDLRLGAAVASRILYLDRGRIAADDVPAALLDPDRASALPLVRACARLAAMP